MNKALSVIFLLGVLFSLEGCIIWENALSTAPSRMNDPSTRLSITIESVPSGASVYSVRNGSPSTKLGVTPVTLYYTALLSLGVYGNGPEAIENVSKSNSFKTEEYFYFNCMVIKEGYSAYKIRNLIVGPCYNFRQAMGKSLTFTALLELSQPNLSQPQQQQQQQQQQTVVLGAGLGETQQIGTVMVSSDVQGAEVYVDGVFVGNAPANLKLKDGIHIIEVKKADYQSYRKEIRVSGGSEVSLRADLIR